MATATMHVDVVSAEEQIFSGEAEFVVLPGVMGELGIYPRHAPLFTEIKPGAVRMKVPNQEREELVFVAGGFLEVQPHLGDRARRHRDPARRTSTRRPRSRRSTTPRKRWQHKASKEEVAAARSLALGVARAARGDPQDAPPRLTPLRADGRCSGRAVRRRMIRAP